MVPNHKVTTRSKVFPGNLENADLAWPHCGGEARLIVFQAKGRGVQF